MLVVVMPADPHADQNPLVLQRWRFVADKIESDPGLLEIPLQNIRRWLGSDRIGNPWALREWQGIIEGATALHPLQPRPAGAQDAGVRKAIP